MTETDKKVVFHDFTAKAIQRLKDKKVRKHQTLYVPSLDENIKIQSLMYPEIVECMELSEKGEGNKGDKYSVYLSVVEPPLSELAVELKERGEITEYTDIVDIFDMSEIGEISVEIMKLSGYLGNQKVTVVDELKN